MPATKRSHRGARDRAKASGPRAMKDLPQRQAEALKVKGGSPNLMLACASGQHIKEATLNLRNT